MASRAEVYRTTAEKARGWQRWRELHSRHIDRNSRAKWRRTMLHTQPDRGSARLIVMRRAFLELFSSLAADRLISSLATQRAVMRVLGRWQELLARRLAFRVCDNIASWRVKVRFTCSKLARARAVQVSRREDRPTTQPLNHSTARCFMTARRSALSRLGGRRSPAVSRRPSSQEVSEYVSK